MAQNPHWGGLAYW